MRDLKHGIREISAENLALRSSKEKLQRSSDHYVELFDFAPVTYARLDAFGMVEQINLAGSRLLGVERAHIVGHPFLGRVAAHDRRRFLEHLRQCRSGNGVIESALELSVGDSRMVACRLYSKPALYEDRVVLPTIIVDLTEQLRLEQARLDAERQRDQAERDREAARASVRAKDRLLATVSHELRTPLTPALLAATRLAATEEIGEHARKLAATIKRNIELEAHLIDDLLDLARLGRDRIEIGSETVDVHQALQDAITICRPAGDTKRLTIGVHLAAYLYHAHGDETRLRQVFWNLLNNAIKFSDPGSTITVCSSNGPENVLRVSVRDSGAGMDADTLGTLFSPFESTHLREDGRGGLGLGLTICKGILDAHGGQIWAASEGPGRGSSFEIELPTVRPSPDRAAPPSQSQVAPTKS